MSETLQVEKIRATLAEINDPETGRSISKTNQIADLQVDGNKACVTIGLTSFSRPLRHDFHRQIVEKLNSAFPKTAFPDCEFQIEFGDHDRPPLPIGTVGLTAKAVIAGGSGKGWVGKRTAAAALALALHRFGCKVGLMDADVYGPSIPHLLGVRGQVRKDGEKIGALDFHGMKVMSIGFMVPPDQAVIWRGPMLHSTMQTFVRDVAWGNLDFLIIDMPPGTGDVALSLSQLLPLTGAVVVCTPQEVALLDAIKAVAMFEKVKIPVLGLIENMSSFICPDNGKQYDIFGKGGARKYAEQAAIPFLGEIPINIQLRERGDAGEMSANFDDPNVAPYLDDVALAMCRTLALKTATNPPVPQLPVLG